MKVSWAKSNPERHRENVRRWRIENREKYLEQHRRHAKNWAINNPEKKKQLEDKFRSENPEKVRAYGKRAAQKYYLSHKEEEKARSKKWRKDNPDKYQEWVEKNREKIRANSRRYEYNMQPEQYNQIFSEQDGKCAICREELVNPDVDHDHSCCSNRGTCGKCTRGLLCHRCNTILGLAEDSLVLLQNAQDYISKWKGLHERLQHQPSLQAAGRTDQIQSRYQDDARID